MSLFLPYFGRIYAAFNPAFASNEKKEAYLNQWLTRDIYIRFMNMTENITEGRIKVGQAKDHVFFLNCKQTLSMIRDLSERLGPITPTKRYCFPRTCRLIDTLSTEFDNRTFGNSFFDWIAACPANVAQYINDQNSQNANFHQQRVSSASAGASTSYSTAASYNASGYDLMKFIRNHDSHFYNKGLALRETLGERPRKYLDFFVRRFPALATQAFVLYNKIRNSYAVEASTVNLCRHLKDIEYSIVSSFDSDACDGFVVYNNADDENDM